MGQVIELVGSNFGAGTQVLFNTRDSQGNAGLDSVLPLAVNADGTRLQVVVPDLATTGDIRVSNLGVANLGFTGNPDSIYRQVTVSFTPSSGDAVIRFADLGIEDVDNESWGLDNVKVARGATPVFEDDFESGAQPQWSRNATEAAPLFTRFWVGLPTARRF